MSQAPKGFHLAWPATYTLDDARTNWGGVCDCDGPAHEGIPLGVVGGVVIKCKECRRLRGWRPHKETRYERP